MLAVIVTPWLVLVHRRPGFVEELFHKAHLHTVTSMEGHGEPPGYHTVLIFATFFPWSLLLPHRHRLRLEESPLGRHPLRHGRETTVAASALQRKACHYV